MKNIKLGFLIFCFILFNSCKNGQKDSIDKETENEIQVAEINDFKFDKSLIIGSWVDTSEVALNFTLFANGTARSDNMKTLLYKNWRINGNKIILTIESIGNGTSSINDETFNIQKLNTNELILKAGNSSFKYIKSKEEFEIINTDKLTRTLTETNKNLSALEVMKLYYPVQVEKGEGNELIEISEIVAENGNTIVTLIHDNLLDDSVKAKKYLMELKKTKNQWVIISLKKNWKCREGRGHTEWGIEYCL